MDKAAEFNEILREHQRRYPGMQPQDLGKLAYQSEFGPEHMIAEEKSVFSFLLQEWKEIRGASECHSENIGNGLCRFPLGECSDMEGSARLLAALFLRTARETHGTQEGLQMRLDLLRNLSLPEMDKWLGEYRAQGFPLLSHSTAYRERYHPHYRLLRKSYAGFFPALLRIRQLVSKQGRVLVAVDGRCGSGKTALSELISAFFPCAVFHMDDFYLPMERRAPGWETIPAGNMDLERFSSEVLCPAERGETVRYRPYSCQSGNYGKTSVVPPQSLAVVEGSYSHHPLLLSHCDLKIFLTCSPETQAQRLRNREGEYFSTFQKRWIPLEENYFCKYTIPDKSSMVLDTSDFFD